MLREVEARALPSCELGGVLKLSHHSRLDWTRGWLRDVAVSRLVVLERVSVFRSNAGEDSFARESSRADGQRPGCQEHHDALNTPYHIERVRQQHYESIPETWAQRLDGHGLPHNTSATRSPTRLASEQRRRDRPRPSKIAAGRQRRTGESDGRWRR